MKKIMLVVSLLVMANSSFAKSKVDEMECLERLTGTFSYDSKSFVQNTDIIDGKHNVSYENNALVNAAGTVKILLESKFGCDLDYISFERLYSGEKAKASCVNIIPGDSYSKACYVETNVGYFFITWDMLTAVHTTFNRWD